MSPARRLQPYASLSITWQQLFHSTPSAFAAASHSAALSILLISPEQPCPCGASQNSLTAIVGSLSRLALLVAVVMLVVMVVLVLLVMEIAVVLVMAVVDVVLDTVVVVVLLAVAVAARVDDGDATVGCMTGVCGRSRSGHRGR